MEHESATRASVTRATSGTTTRATAMCSCVATAQCSVATEAAVWMVHHRARALVLTASLEPTARLSTSATASTATRASASRTSTSTSADASRAGAASTASSRRAATLPATTMASAGKNFDSRIHLVFSLLYQRLILQVRRLPLHERVGRYRLSHPTSGGLLQPH